MSTPATPSADTITTIFVFLAFFGFPVFARYAWGRILNDLHKDAEGVATALTAYQNSTAETLRRLEKLANRADRVLHRHDVRLARVEVAFGRVMLGSHTEPDNLQDDEEDDL